MECIACNPLDMTSRVATLGYLAGGGDIIDPPHKKRARCLVACSAMRTNSCQAGPRGGPSRYHYYQVRSAPPRGLHLVPSVARPLFRACPQRRLPVDLGVEINLQSNRKKKRWSSRSEASYFRARSWTIANLNYSRPKQRIRPRGGSSRNPRVAE